MAIIGVIKGDATRLWRTWSKQVGNLFKISRDVKHAVSEDYIVFHSDPKAPNLNLKPESYLSSSRYRAEAQNRQSFEIPCLDPTQHYLVL